MSVQGYLGGGQFKTAKEGQFMRLLQNVQGK